MFTGDSVVLTSGCPFSREGMKAQNKKEEKVRPVGNYERKLLYCSR